MPQSNTKLDVLYVTLPFVLILLTAACAPTTEYQNTAFVSMPAAWESRLVELETKASNPESWPTDLEEAEQFIDELGQLIGGLSPLAEANYFPQLAELRWTAIAFEALHREPTDEQGSAIDETPYSLAIQLRAIADERSASLDSDPGQPDLILMHMLLNRANMLEDQDIDRRLNAACEYLGNESCQYPENSDFGEEDSPSANTDLTFPYELLDYLTFYEAARPDWNEKIRHVRERLENRIAALEAERLNRPRRDYQAWALGKIWAFEEALEKIKSDDGWSFGLNPFSGTWDEEELTQIQDAMIAHLLPIDQTQLDLAIMKRFQSGFDVGWEILSEQDERKAQTCVAIASAIIVKRTYLNFAVDEPRSDTVINNTQWKDRGCDQ